MGLQTFDERTILAAVKLVAPADGTGAVALLPVHSSDRRVDTIIATNRDTIAHVVTLTLNNGATTIILGSVSLAAGAGTAGTPAVDVLAACLPATVVGLLLVPADNLLVTMAVAIQATFDVGFKVIGGIF